MQQQQQSESNQKQIAQLAHLQAAAGDSSDAHAELSNDKCDS